LTRQVKITVYTSSYSTAYTNELIKLKGSFINHVNAYCPRCQLMGSEQKLTLHKNKQRLVL